MNKKLSILTEYKDKPKRTLKTINIKTVVFFNELVVINVDILIKCRQFILKGFDNTIEILM